MGGIPSEQWHNWHRIVRYDSTVHYNFHLGTVKSYLMGIWGSSVQIRFLLTAFEVLCYLDLQFDLCLFVNVVSFVFLSFNQNRASFLIE